MKLGWSNTLLLSSSLTALVMAGSAAWAQDAATSDNADEEIVVTGSRLPDDLSSFAGSVTIVGPELIEEQSRITSDIREMLGNTVPGLGVSRGNAAGNDGVNLRGRKPAVLVDGLPQTSPLRDVFRDIRVVSPSMIEQVEVIRGSTAIYGMGGAGGVINYITKRPTDEGLQFQTDVTFGSSLTKVNDEAFHYGISQSITGKYGRFDFIGTAFVEQTGAHFDAHGERIAPDPEYDAGGTSEMETNSLFGKIGFDLSPDARIEASYASYEAEQDTDYTVDFGNTAGGYQHATLKAAVYGPYFDNGYAVDPLTHNDVASLTFTHEDVLGSTVRIQAAYQDYSAVFGFYTIEEWGLPPRESNPLGGGQSDLLSEKKSVRLDVTTPLKFFDGRLLWGVDYLNDTTSQDIYETGWHWVPEVEQKDLSFFMQFDGQLTDRINVRGGVRYVDFVAEVPDYTTLEYWYAGAVWDGTQFVGGLSTGGVDVQGADLSYNLWLPNFGVIFDINDNWNTFVAYSEGFLISDLGRILRGWTEPTIDALQNDAQVVETYEWGLRTNYDTVNAELGIYYSKSDLGTSFVLTGGTDTSPIFEIARAPERVWGLDLAVEWQVTEDLSVNSSYSWVDGEYDPQGDGSYEQMTSYRINPATLMTQVKYDINANWELQVQNWYSFSWKPFGPDEITWGQNPIDSFFVVDASVTGQVGPGYFTVGIANLLNEDYAPPYSQSAKHLDFYHYKAPGSELRLKYSVAY